MESIKPPILLYSNITQRDVTIQLMKDEHFITNAKYCVAMMLQTPPHFINDSEFTGLLIAQDRPLVVGSRYRK